MKQTKTLLEKVKKDIDKVKIVSFDIFDTLLLRPYIKPTDLFKHIELSEYSDGFAKSRIEAEKRVRKLYCDLEDITIDKIYEEIADKYKDFMVKEMEWERKVLQPNPEMKEVFDYVKNNKKDIIIVSDMYLPEDFLSSVLIEKGFTGFKKLYVSSKYGKLKYSGNLFREVLKDLNVSPKEILHIGDSERNDYIIPKKQNLNAYLYPNNINKLIKNNYRFRKLCKRHPNSIGISMILGAFSIWSINNNADYWKKFGYNIAGPICLNFMNWIYHDLSNKNIDNIIFIARDGYILQKVFEVISNKIPTHYIYAPRALNLVCRLNYEKEGKFAYQHTQAILNFYRQKDTDLFNLPKVTKAKESLKQLEDNIIKINSLAEKEKENYRNYIKQKGIKGNVATVDSVSLFFSAQRFFEDLFPENKFQGYYYQIQKGANITNNVYSYKDISSYTHDLKLIEFIMTSPEAPINYIEEGKPIYKAISDIEQKRIEICSKYSDAAVDFAKDIKRFFNSLDLFLTKSEISDYIECFEEYPSNEDKKNFSDVLFAYDTEHKDFIPLYSYAISLSDFVFHPIKTCKILKKVQWRSVVQSFIVNLFCPIKLKIKGLKKITLSLFPYLSKRWFLIEITISDEWFYKFIIGNYQK